MLRYRVKRQPQLEAERQGRRRGDVVESDPGASAWHGIPVSETVRKKRSPWLVAVGVAGMLGVAVFCVFFRPVAREAMGKAAAVSAAASDPPAVLQPDARAVRELPADPSSALTMALAHFSTALEVAGGENPEEVLRKVSKPGQTCAMVWTNDSLSLVFGGGPTRPNALAHQLEDCAEAVSRVH
jgi:hypothetical protein